MNEHILIDILLFFLAAVFGGLVGGTFALVLLRGSSPNRNLRILPRRQTSGEIIQFPKRWDIYWLKCRTVFRCPFSTLSDFGKKAGCERVAIRQSLKSRILTVSGEYKNGLPRFAFWDSGFERFWKVMASVAELDATAKSHQEFCVGRDNVGKRAEGNLARASNQSCSMSTNFWW